VDGVTRQVHLILMGHYSVTISLDGRSGESFRLPCVYCCFLEQPSAIGKKLLQRFSDYETMRDGGCAARMPSSILCNKGEAALYAKGPLPTILAPRRPRAPCPNSVGHCGISHPKTVAQMPCTCHYVRARRGCRSAFRLSHFIQTRSGQRRMRKRLRPRFYRTSACSQPLIGEERSMKRRASRLGGTP